MKTNNIVSTLHFVGSHRWQTAAFATIAGFLLAASVPAAPPATKCGAGLTTARYVYSSSLNEAAADYNLALANANNVATAAARTEAKKQASADYADARELAQDQYRERRELCKELNEDRYNPVINPADFLSPAEIAVHPNSLFPLVQGTTFNYKSVEGGVTELTAFAVTRQTRVILGVTCIVVRDTLKRDGQVHEDTVDWFAQDRSGNVWYFGENTAEYEDGLITTTAGSWEAGVDSAQPGIVMFAQPVVGKVYRQELMLGEAEDAAEIIALDENVTVVAGSYAHCLKTEDFTPIEPDNSEFKYYAPGIGNVLTTNPDTGKRTELVSVQKN